MAERFDQKTAAEILERAAELQLQRGGSSDLFSIADLEDAAAAAGIERALVRRAATEVAVEDPKPISASLWLGGPSSLRLQKTLDVELSDDAADRAVELISEMLGEFGSTERVGRGLRWRTGSGDMASHNNNLAARSLQVALLPRTEGLVVRIEERMSPLIGGLFGGILGGVGGGTLALPLMPVVLLGLPALVPTVVLLWMGSAYAITRQLYAHRVQARNRQLELLLERLVNLLTDAK